MSELLTPQERHELTDEKIIAIRKGPRFAPLGSLEPWAETIAFARAVLAANALRGDATPPR